MHDAKLENLPFHAIGFKGIGIEFQIKLEQSLKVHFLPATKSFERGQLMFTFQVWFGPFGKLRLVCQEVPVESG